MTRLSMTASWILLIGLWGCKSAEPPAPAPAPEPKATLEQAEGEIEPAPQETARRERAGIDLGSPSIDEGEIDGRKPAARIIQEQRAEAPARLEGEKAEGARAARAFVLGPWKRAVEQSDPSALLGLLDSSFTGHIPTQGDGKPATREAWPEARGGIGKPVRLGNLAIAMVRGKLGDSTVSLHEQVGEGDSCRSRTRELTLAVSEDKALRVRVVTVGESQPCDNPGASQVAAAHQHLVKLWKDEDRLEAASTTPSVWLRDVGRDVTTYDRESLHQGEGRWLLEALSRVEATEENTSRTGTVGEVVSSDGLLFSYHWTQERWTLQGLDRVK